MQMLEDKISQQSVDFLMAAFAGLLACPIGKPSPRTHLIPTCANLHLSTIFLTSFLLSCFSINWIGVDYGDPAAFGGTRHLCTLKTAWVNRALFGPYGHAVFRAVDKDLENWADRVSILEVKLRLHAVENSPVMVSSKKIYRSGQYSNENIDGHDPAPPLAVQLDDVHQSMFKIDAGLYLKIVLQHFTQQLQQQVCTSSSFCFHKQNQHVALVSTISKDVCVLLSGVQDVILQQAFETAMKKHKAVRISCFCTLVRVRVMCSHTLFWCADGRWRHVVRRIQDFRSCSWWPAWLCVTILSLYLLSFLWAKTPSLTIDCFAVWRQCCTATVCRML